MATAKLEELIKSIEGMTVLELSDLVKALEERFDVKANMPMMAAPMAGAAGAAGGAAAAQGEKNALSPIFFFPPPQ